jgi:hypothetical protein
VPPEALREDPGRLDRRRVVEVADDGERPDRKPPGPALTRRIVLGHTGDLDHTEDGLPDRGVEDGELARLDRRAPGGGVGLDRRSVDPRVERLVPAPANEEPALGQIRSTMPASAWPWPMHIEAMP